MKCSIIIPYNNDRTILNMTLNSIENQDYDKNDFEVQFVNNSTDDLSAEINQRKLNSNINYNYVVCKQQGRSNARNAGIKNANGEILIFLDCDQVVGQDFVSQHCKFFEQHSNDHILQFGLRKQIFPIEPGKDIIEYNSVDDLDNKYEILKTGHRTRISNASYYGNNVLNNYSYVDDIRLLVFQAFNNDISNIKGKFAFVQSNNFSLKKCFLEQYGGFDENFKGWGCEDWELAYRMQQGNIKILYNPNIEILHIYHNAVYDNNRFMQWKQNVDYFIQKYDGQINNLYALEEFFNPEKRKLLSQKTDIDNVWIYCFKNFENGFHS